MHLQDVEINFKVRAVTKTLLIDSENRFLMIKRSIHSDKRAGAWDFCGGRVDYEDLLESDRTGKPFDLNANWLEVAAKREIREEVGIEAKSLHSLLTHAAYEKEREWITLRIGFICTDFTGVVKLSQEHDEYAWLTIDEAKKLDFGGPEAPMHHFIGRLIDEFESRVTVRSDLSEGKAI